MGYGRCVRPRFTLVIPTSNLAHMREMICPSSGNWEETLTPYRILKVVLLDFGGLSLHGERSAVAAPPSRFGAEIMRQSVPNGPREWGRSRGYCGGAGEIPATAPL